MGWEGFGAMEDSSESRVIRVWPDLAQLLGVSKSLAYRLVHEGHIRHIRVGKKFLISREAVNEFLRGE